MPALIFDCDGVLADTERDGHRPAFNQTFAEVGLPVEWSDEEYGEKLKIAFVDAHREYLDANPGKHDPPSLLRHVREAVKDMAEYHIRAFGSAGRAATTSAAA